VVAAAGAAAGAVVFEASMGVAIATELAARRSTATIESGVALGLSLARGAPAQGLRRRLRNAKAVGYFFEESLGAERYLAQARW